ncbi:hypothetical protein [Gallaecimonas sp. GXIMD1310]|uniref:hypothetical protein n=1 Tax=Gallaecimonas sp. GXIMD1310 TaxID=3131926 RepID=UPI003255FD81
MRHNYQLRFYQGKRRHCTLLLRPMGFSDLLATVRHSLKNQQPFTHAELCYADQCLVLPKRFSLLRFAWLLQRLHH